MLGVMLVGWCQIIPENERKTQTGDEIQQENLTGEILETWETTQTVVITEANSWDIVTQTGDNLIYRNEVYGFQVKLGKAWKGAQIAGVWWGKKNRSTIIFTLPYKYVREIDEEVANPEIFTDMNPDSITVLGADIYPVDIYEKIGVSWCEYRYPYPCETEEKSKEARESMREWTVGHNNYFYFVANKDLTRKIDDPHYESHYSKRKDIFDTIEFFDVE